MSLVLILVAWVGISILPVKIAADLVGGRQTGIFSCSMAIIAALLGGIVVKVLIPIGLLAPLVYLLVAGSIYMAVLGTTYFRGIIVALVQLVVGLITVLIITAILGPSIRISF